MTTDAVMEMVATIRSEVLSNDDGVSVNMRDFFTYTERPRHISYKAFAEHADNDLKKFYNVGRIGNNNNNDVTGGFVACMRSWMQTVSDEEMATMLVATPSGLSSSGSAPSWDFTPFQRFFLAYYCFHPFAATTTISVSRGDLVEEIGSGFRPPKNGLSYQASKIEGSVPRHFIVDLPTALGKTSLSAALGVMMLNKTRFELLKHRELQRFYGCIVQGPPKVLVARLALIVCSGNTFYHFCDEYKRLVQRWNAERHDNVVLWSGMSGAHSVLNALGDDPGPAILWIIPTAQLNPVLKAHPNISVAFAVLDEMSHDVPRERSETNKSSILKTVILQATPQLLVESSRGRSILNGIFGGPIEAPSSLRQVVRDREWTRAQRTIEHACRLSLCTTSSFFRTAIRKDLHTLMPSGMDVVFVQSRKVTMASHLQQNGLDVVPADFVNVLMSMFKDCYLDEHSIEAIRRVCSSDGPFSISDLVNVMGTVAPRTSSYSTIYETRLNRTVERVKTRLLEFKEECPICSNDPCATGSGGVRIFGCCGYCVCDQCSSRLLSCPFCRSSKPTSLSRVDVPGSSAPAARVEETQAPDAPETIPERPDLVESISSFSPNNHSQTLVALLRSWTSPRNLQVYNLAMVLHALYYSNFRKTLVVVFPTRYARVGQEGDSSSLPFNMHDMSLATGFDIVNVDSLMNGQGSRFKKVMARFDDPSETMALVTVGSGPMHYSLSSSKSASETFLTGTNLVSADSLIFVGPVPTRIHTQAIGRICRVSSLRDNTRAIPVIKIVQRDHVGDVPLTGRRRDHDEMRQ